MQTERSVELEINASSDNNAHSSSIPKEVAGIIGTSSNYEGPFLPEAIIFNILVWLPADILHNVMRFVCRNWYNIIHDPDFIKAHLCRSPIGLLLRELEPPFSAFFLEMVKGTENVTGRKLNFRFRGSFVASCDGLVLVCDPKNFEVYHIVNPVTKQQVTLPPLPMSLTEDRFSSALACAPSTGEYKVLHVYVCARTGKPYPVILTVNVDHSWRLITTEHIRDDPQSIFHCEPITVLGFIYLCSCGTTCVLALDVEAEIFYQVPIPKDCRGRSKLYITSERFLTLAVQDPETEWVFWALMDSKLGEWRKLFKIDLEIQSRVLRSVFSCHAAYNIYGHLSPCAVFKNGDIVFFESLISGGIYIAYNVKKGEFVHYWKPRKYADYVGHTHVNSLLALKS